VPMFDNHLAPPVFHGLTTDDTEAWFWAFGKYAVFRNMTEGQKVTFLPVLSKDVASDWYDILTQEVKRECSYHPGSKNAFRLVQMAGLSLQRRLGD